MGDNVCIFSVFILCGIIDTCDWEDGSSQKFEYLPKTGQIQLLSANNICLSVNVRRNTFVASVDLCRSGVSLSLIHI